ncbi:hypothetical protein GCM10020254_47490 [Streptomyces goshikiensis]
MDANAAGQALAALATVEELVKSWEHTGPAVLRAGGLSVRDLKRTAATLDATEGAAAFWIELAYAAGLLAGDGEADERYAPTPAFDDWCELPPAERWSVLAAAWLPATRTAGLVGEQDAKARTLSVLGPDLDRSAAPEVRRRVLDLLAELPEGGSADPAALLARLAWERPVRGTSDLRARLAHWALTEAEVLGVTGRGALSAPGRALLEGRDPAAPLAPLLPEPVDHVLLQADLTAVAPGPLRRPLDDTLAVLADVESKGGATVYRFTPGSVRRALDAGHTASDLHAFLAEHSRTPVPQPLTYLIDDVSRRHGHLRVGAASSYVRCDDDGMLNEILADKRSAGLGLRRLAPTVLAAQAEPTTLLDGLRAMGYAPAAESRTGDVLGGPGGRPPDRAALGARTGAGRPAGGGRDPAGRGRTGHPRGRPGGDGGAQGAARALGAGPGGGRTPAHQRGGDPGDGAGGRADRVGGVDRVRQRGRGGEPAGHRAGTGGGRLRHRVRPHGGRGADVRAAPHHGRGRAGGGPGLSGRNPLAGAAPRRAP